jgi:hypothetical protein
MTANVPSPTLADLQKDWDCQVTARTREGFRHVAFWALVYAPFVCGLMYLAGGVAVLGIFLLMVGGSLLLIVLDTRAFFGPRPTQHSFDENTKSSKELCSSAAVE